MRKLSYLACSGILGISSWSLAAGPTTQPIPVDRIPVPPARTAVTVAKPIGHSQKMSLPASVLVFAFQPIGEAQSVAWVGPAAQETIVTDLTRLTNLQATSAAAASPNSALAAIKQAKSNGVDAVILGNVQAEGAQLRFTGQVINVKTGKAMGGLLATGDFRDLFSLEDDLGRQAKSILRPPPPGQQVAALTKSDEMSQIFDLNDSTA
ncbi:MAG TPA: hypothetical protein VMD30_02465, partial [Tepidisphaeraceae bacterium]|nr:hypothetical protein [Tepidisphaeraceae bacterium]